MTFYLDKENNILFIVPKKKEKSHVIEDVIKSFKNSKVPYQIIFLDREDELIII